MIDEAIDTAQKSRGCFLKRDQIKGNIVRRFQHVAVFLSDAMLIYSFSTNRIKNNPLTKHNVEIYTKMLVRSKYASKGKMTMKRLEPIDSNRQIIELRPTIKIYYGNI